MTAALRVLVVDDEELARLRLRSLVGECPSPQAGVAGEAANAAQALEGRGEIRLRTRIARQVTLAKRRYKLALELHVIDNGPGIPAELRDRIFYPLVSGREGGSGLGLSLAQSFIEQHQGMIEVDSRPGRTCFTILLPITERA